MLLASRHEGPDEGWCSVELLHLEERKEIWRSAWVGWWVGRSVCTYLYLCIILRHCCDC